jgi:putative tryptophan/tyrosine transport system substrate-binding protein
MIGRRDFIAGLGSAAAWPAVAWAQQQAMQVVGFVHTGASGAAGGTLVIDAIRRGLAETGYIEGRNLIIEYRWAEDHLERLPELLADLVRSHVTAIVAVATPAVFAAKAATLSIPVIFSIGTDPVYSGLVASLNHPGGNLTGAYNLNNEVVAKRLEVLHGIARLPNPVAYLVNPENTAFAETETKELGAAAGRLSLNLLILNVKDSRGLEIAFAALVDQRASGLIVGGDALFFDLRDRIVTLAADHRVPATYPWREATVAGGLASYGTDFGDSFRQAGVYAGHILKGKTPADLPVQQVTKLQLVINLQTAKALGLTIPETLLATADEVIQ